MLTRPNDGGGTTLVLGEADDLDAVPKSDRDTVTDSIRHAFRDSVSYFAELASRTSIPNLQRYLSSVVAEGRWTLLLADTYMMQRNIVAGFQWAHPNQTSCMFGPATGACDDNRFAAFYDDLTMVQWESIGFAGGIVPYRELITLDKYGTSSTNPIFPADSTSVFGNSSCGDMMVCNLTGDAGYLSHENSASYIVGSFPEMVNWVFGELIENRTPEFEYERC